MHPLVLYQLVTDRNRELAADAGRRARPLPSRRRDRRAAGHDMVRREWRALIRALQAR